MTDRLLMSNAELNRLHSSELSLALSVSRTEVDRVRELHRLEWVGRTDTKPFVPRPTVTTSAREALTPSVVLPVVRKSDARVCRDCCVPLPPQVTRGRPPVRCQSCKEKLATALPPVSTVNTCGTCHKKFPKTGKRGRQPSNCPKCAKRIAIQKGQA